ncbi:putative mitochondrial protein [Cucumis melo var. makuwa]|uniref:Mitochondrial protein n=1 Tax=Cucumis melo var. makuwa TaxID=1194695 RepID=A0A5D3C8N5_CUCMM|nr:putative mitochondrial protein [Cucumis melo var. makuwa]TYK08243.1 putative mitochondrial protein [Cucumis melo var. makuwa]
MITMGPPSEPVASPNGGMSHTRHIYPPARCYCQAISPRAAIHHLHNSAGLLPIHVPPRCLRFVCCPLFTHHCILILAAAFQCKISENDRSDIIVPEDMREKGNVDEIEVRAKIGGNEAEQDHLGNLDEYDPSFDLTFLLC